MRRQLVALLLIALASVGCATYQGGQLYSSGTEALDRGDTARAIADLERAAELVPHASEIQNHLGLAYAAEGREREALLAFRRAVALDCGNQAARHNLRAAEARDTPVADP
jgi:Flp pilus assembly protein TadD